MACPWKIFSLVSKIYLCHSGDISQPCIALTHKKSWWCFDSHALAVQGASSLTFLVSGRGWTLRSLAFSKVNWQSTKLLLQCMVCKRLVMEGQQFLYIICTISLKTFADIVADFSSSSRWLLLKAWDTPLSVLPTSLLEL